MTQPLPASFVEDRNGFRMYAPKFRRAPDGSTTIGPSNPNNGWVLLFFAGWLGAVLAVLLAIATRRMGSMPDDERAIVVFGLSIMLFVGSALAVFVPIGMHRAWRREPQYATVPRTGPIKLHGNDVTLERAQVVAIRVAVSTWFNGQSRTSSRVEQLQAILSDGEGFAACPILTCFGGLCWIRTKRSGERLAQMLGVPMMQVKVLVPKRTTLRDIVWAIAPGWKDAFQVGVDSRPFDPQYKQPDLPIRPAGPMSAATPDDRVPDARVN